VTYIFSADQVEPYVRLFGLAVVTNYAAIAIFSSKRCWFLPMLMQIPMLMMLALPPMLLLDAFDAAANDANADAKMLNVACHFVGAYDVLLLPPILHMLMLLRQLMRADSCDCVMLKCVCIYVRLCLSKTRVCVMFVYVPLCVRSFSLCEQMHSKSRHFFR